MCNHALVNSSLFGGGAGPNSGTYNAQGIELDFNNDNAHRGDADGGAGLAPPVAYGWSSRPRGERVLDLRVVLIEVPRSPIDPSALRTCTQGSL